MRKRQRQNPKSKLNKQTITMFNYYKEVVYPELFSKQNFVQICKKSSKLKDQKRGIVYNYVSEQCSGFQADLDELTIIEAVKNSYICQNTVQIASHSYFKKQLLKVNYLPIYGQVSEQIDFVFLKQDFNADEVRNQLIKKSRQKKMSSMRSSKNIGQTYFLYVIHYSIKNEDAEAEQLFWENYVQKYHFSFENKGDQIMPVIKYQAIFSYNSSCIFSYKQSGRLLQKYFEKSMIKTQDSRLEILFKVQKNIMNIQSENIKRKGKQLQNISLHPCHKRLLVLSTDQKNLFDKIKPKAYHLFQTINPRKETNPIFMDNLICRFLKSQNYKQDKVIEALQYYLIWQQKMRSKYTINSFKKYLQMDIFIYLGKDLLGRPVVYNFGRNVKCSLIDDFDEFLEFYLYYLEIHLVDQMQGYVDQFTLLADLSNMTSDNTKLSFTKNLISQSMKLSLGRHYRFIAFEGDSVTDFLYNNVFKYILPDSLIDILRIYKEKDTQMMTEIKKQISLQVLPQNLEGKSKIINRLLGEQYEAKLTEAPESDRSLFYPSTRHRI